MDRVRSARAGCAGRVLLPTTSSPGMTRPGPGSILSSATAWSRASATPGRWTSRSGRLDADPEAHPVLLGDRCGPWSEWDISDSAAPRCRRRCVPRRFRSLSVRLHPRPRRRGGFVRPRQPPLLSRCWTKPLNALPTCRLRLSRSAVVLPGVSRGRVPAGVAAFQRRVTGSAPRHGERPGRAAAWPGPASWAWRCSVPGALRGAGGATG